MKRAPVGWTIEPHICTACMGRVLSRVEGELRMYRCACCGVERAGHTAAVICTCGIKFMGRRSLEIRCEPNIAKSPEFPAEIIARQA